MDITGDALRHFTPGPTYKTEALSFLEWVYDTGGEALVMKGE